MDTIRNRRLAASRGGPSAGGRAGQLRSRRGGTDSGATGALWLVAHALGAGSVLTDSTGTATIGLAVVLGFAVLPALLGWGALAALEHFTGRAGAVWTVLAAGVTLLSLLPVLAEHATAGTGAALILIHLAVAAVVIPVLRRSAASPAGR